VKPSFVSGLFENPQVFSGITDGHGDLQQAKEKDVGEETLWDVWPAATRG